MREAAETRRRRLSVARSGKNVSLYVAGHSIHNIRVKGLWLLFTDNASDKKYMESHLIDKLGSRRPGGINEKKNFFFFASLLSFFSFFLKFTLETPFSNSLDLV